MHDAASEAHKNFRWDDFRLPDKTYQEARRLLRRGTVSCAQAMVGGAVVVYRMSWGWDRSAAVFTVIVGFLCLQLFTQGEQLRWAGRQQLSRLTAYRDEQGCPRRSLSATRTGRLPGQSALLGWSWASASAVVSTVGAIVAVVGVRHFFMDFGDWGAQWPFVPLTGAVAGILLCLRGNGMHRRGRQHLERVIPSPNDLSPGKYTLYLRDFRADGRLARPHRLADLEALVLGWFTTGRSEEERLAAAFAWSGTLVGIGRPKDRLPFAGAHRTYLGRGDWQQQVRTMMRHAALVVIVLGTGPGTLWELGEALRILPPERLLLLVPMNAREYAACRATVAAELDKQAAAHAGRGKGRRWIPPVLPPYGKGTWLPSRIRGLIYFTPDRESVFVALKRPPLRENHLLGALDRALWAPMLQLTDHERRTHRNAR